MELNEEEKEAIEKLSNPEKINLIEIIRKFKREGIENFIITRPEYIEELKNLILKQQKEIEEKQTIIYAGAEKVKGLEKEIEELKTDLEILQDDIKDKNIIYTDTPEFEENYIPKKKIEDKMKKFKEGINNLDTYENFSEHDVVEAIIEILEQLLKGE